MLYCSKSRSFDASGLSAPGEKINGSKLPGPAGERNNG